MACHTTCEDYKNWKIEHENRRNAFIEKKWVDEQIRASKIEFSERYWRKINKKRK